MIKDVVKKGYRDWGRYFFYRKESLRTTWKLRLLIVALAVLVAAASHEFWARKLVESLPCTEQSSPSDALLLENFDPDYLVFERAEALRRAGVANRVLVPLKESGRNPETPNTVGLGIAQVMARVAHLPSIETIPIEHIEPITLNAARQIRDFLKTEGVKSVVVVTPGFRSRRSLLVYSSVFTPAGIAVGCVPVWGSVDMTNWTGSLHGIQEVGLQFLKLQYYRFWVFL